MEERLLNLTMLAGVDLDAYRLVGFSGREAICELFDYSLEILTREEPRVSDWIGKGVEFNIAPAHERPRAFGGQIHEVLETESGAGFRRFMLQVRPVFSGTLFARGISFYQDKTALDVLRDLTKTLRGFQFSQGDAKAAKRAYAVKYEETEFEFITRMLAQDGILFYFKHDAGAPLFHRMHLASSAKAYKDIELEGELEFALGNRRNSITQMRRGVHLHPHLHGFTGVAINTLDQLIEGKEPIQKPNWSRALDSRRYENFGGVADQAELDQRKKAVVERFQQEAETITGSSTVPQLYPTVRIPNNGDEQPAKLVVTSVFHSATDPAGMQNAGGASYHNSFTAIDANRAFRAPLTTERRRAPGPIVGIVAKKGAREGQIEIDGQSRIPVSITHAHPRADTIWLPVQQAWSHGDYGAQFIPRIGTQVMIDFLYGDPDLPFVSGCFYTPSQKYPFPSTRTGWRSKTEKNGGVVQELMFQDKEGGEEIHMYTGRNFRRQIDKDELATINANNVKQVKKNQALTVLGKRDVKVDKTQTVTVTQKALFESKREIEIKVGPSTIRLTPGGIEIKTPKMTIKSDTSIDIQAGAKLSGKAPMVQVDGDGLVTIKGGVVKIN